jgi:hypothetical protein
VASGNRNLVLAIDASTHGWLSVKDRIYCQVSPGQVKAIKNGDVPEAEWQAARLEEYLQRSDHEPLPFRRW